MGAGVGENTVTPTYFQAGGHSLFGIHHSAEAALARDAGIILCYPMGREYVNAFRAFRVLATRLRAQGFHVLRFDYLGCGDSAGEADEGSVAEWVSNILSAVDHVKTTEGVRSISLVGLCLGATLAALAAGQRGGVEKLVMWNPVVQGADYVEELLGQQRAWLEYEAQEGRRVRGLARDDEVLGFPLTGALRADLRCLTPHAVAVSPARDILIMREKEDVACPMREWLRLLECRVEEVCGQGPKLWSVDAPLGKPVVPIGSIESIVRWLDGAAS